MRAANTLRLSREVRLPVRPFAGVSGFSELCLRVTISGVVQEETGFLFDAKQLDDWVVSHLEPAQNAALADFGKEQLAGLWSRLASNTPAGLQLEELDLRFVPTWQWTTFAGENAGDEPVQLVARSFHFCAAHRLHNPSWSNERNSAVFGVCNNVAGHGHNYRLEVTVAASANLEEVEHAVREQVHDRFDHRHLNVDVPELEGVNPTVEALTNFIWSALEAVLPQGWLWSVRLHETPKIAAERRASFGDVRK